MTKATWRRRTFTAGFISALTAPAVAQNRATRVIVGYAPGGGADTLARIFAESAGPRIGQNLVVENRPGASGLIGAQAVTVAAADGSVLLFTNQSPIVIAQYLRPPPPFDPERALTPIAIVARQPILFTVATGSPIRSMDDLRRARRDARGQLIVHPPGTTLPQSRDGGLNYGSAGIGTEMHFSGELLAREAGITTTHVAYRGGGPAVAAMLAGDIDFLPIVTGGIKGQVRSGLVRALATTAPARLPDFPDVPTTAEVGLPKVSVVPWWGIFGPARLAHGEISLIVSAVEAMNGDQAYLRRLADLAIEPTLVTGAPLAEALAADRRFWSGLIESVPALRDIG